MSKNENEIKLFTNKEMNLTVRCIQNEDGSISMNLEDTAIGYGWTKKANSGNTVIRWARVEGFLAEFGVATSGHDDYIPESVFYLLGMKANNDKAKKFQMWLAIDVIPQIRRTGGYIPIKEEEPDEVFLARAVQIAHKTIEKKDEIIAIQKKRIETLEVTEKDWKLLMDAKGTYSINDIGHFIGIGEYKLFAMLRNFGVLFKNDNNDNVPYEKPVHKGKLTTVAAIAPDGSAHSQTRVYPEGIAYITKILRKNGVLEVSA